MALQLTLLILWTRSGVSRTKTSVPAAVFGLLVASVVSGLSFLEHSRSIRPSTLLQVYLLISLLLDAARARSLWLIGSYGSIPSVFIAAVAVKLWIGFFECIEKRRLLQEDYKSLTVESTSGIFNISVFWWLNRLLVTGARNTLSLSDLEEVTQHFRSEVVQQSLEEVWTVGMLLFSAYTHLRLTKRSCEATAPFLSFCGSQDLSLANSCRRVPPTMHDCFQFHSALLDECTSRLSRR